MTETESSVSMMPAELLIRYLESQILNGFGCQNGFVVFLQIQFADLYPGYLAIFRQDVAQPCVVLGRGVTLSNRQKIPVILSALVQGGRTGTGA